MNKADNPWLARAAEQNTSSGLADGSNVAVIGAGPAGSMFTYFLQSMAETVGLDVSVDMYEPRSFCNRGPAGCNHCGGIVSESLVQLLATEGINLPEGVIQRGIDSYMLHTDVGSVRIETPLNEQRIAAVFRGNGPRNAEHPDLESFDRFLLDMARKRGARVDRRLVTDIDWSGPRPRLKHAGRTGDDYDLVVIATGVNSSLLKVLQKAPIGYRRPVTAATYICEFQLDHPTVERYLGTSMHVFLLDTPRIEFAALIPKGNIVTLCMLGDDIDAELIDGFLRTPEVRNCFPPAADLPIRVCHCSPMINVRGVDRPYADRVVFVGDSGVTRLYKDGIGAAYRTAKAAAATAVFQGVSATDFDKHFRPLCRGITRDNRVGQLVFGVNAHLRKRRFCRRAIRSMVAGEQANPGSRRFMSRALWDLFTGSASYREVLMTMSHPRFIAGLSWNLARSLFTRDDTSPVRGRNDGHQHAG